jgi:putative transposase
MVLARATHAELARMVDYLKTENRILRSKLPLRVEVTPAERAQLVKRGKPLGQKIKELITIVSPRTFARWMSGETKSVGNQSTKGGRPRKPEEVCELVVQMANGNGWGLGRIMGELKKLGLKISKGTVRNILLENNFDLGPKRGEGSWDEFIKMYAKTLWASDFFSKKVWTMGSLVEYFVLFFIQPGTRQVHIAGMTTNPDGDWMAQQARNMGMFWAEQPEAAKYLVCDRDTKYTEQFCNILEAEGVQVIKTAIRASNKNA